MVPQALIVLPLNGQNIDDLAGQTINGDERGEYTNIFVGILINLLYKSFTFLRQNFHLNIGLSRVFH